ncbi:MAG: hypothetical protein AAFV43_07670 [Planctomycetota bacterium]
MTSTPRRVLRPVATSLLALVTAGQVGAASMTLINGAGFESSQYQLGDLQGQTAETLGGPLSWFVSPNPTPSTAVVQDSVVLSGEQALRVDRAADSSTRWFVPLPNDPTLPLVGIEWDMMVESAGSGQPFGPFFGIEAYDESPSSLLQLASLGVDATTGDVLYIVRDDGVQPGFLVETGVQVGLDEWNHFRILLDYTTDTSFLFVNGERLLSTPFARDGAVGFSDADITAIAASGDQASLAATGTAYFDNYVVFETDDFSTIPEPASLTLLCPSWMLLVQRRRRR